jgi:hypothetical protein
MRRARIGLLAVCVLAAANEAVAQRPLNTSPQRTQTTSPKWDISFDVLNVITRGNDVHVGDVFTESQNFIGTALNSRLEYGVTNEPIVTKMPDNLSGLVAAAYHGAQWGFGGRAWRVSTHNAVSGSAQTPVSGSTFATTGIRMWDHSLIPVDNNFDPSGVSPVTYHASNELENLRVDGFAERRWIGGNALNVAMRFGVAYAHVKNTRSEGHEESAAGIDTDFMPGFSVPFTNLITLEMDSTSTMDLFGPSLGLAGDTTHARLRIDWLVAPAVVLGTVKSSGSWVDTDNITRVPTINGVPVSAKDVLHGVLPLDTEERTVIPMLDLQLKASIRVTGALRVGAGIFSSNWFKVPTAQAMSVPGNWTDVEGTGWRAQPRDLTFLAYSAFVGFSF